MYRNNTDNDEDCLYPGEDTQDSPDDLESPLECMMCGDIHPARLLLEHACCPKCWAKIQKTDSVALGVGNLKGLRRLRITV